jgi:hypothetical protein
VKITIRANRLELSGSLREPHPDEWFDPLIKEIHSEAIAARLEEVELDIRELEYANAAVWKCFVAWLRLIRTDAQAAYNLRIRSDPKYTWQRVGLASLAVFGGDRLIVEQG